ncbi:unnamed protein product [Ostreobium quekettii]|uniref:Uncharacterized protein n=1 Tax=Ostreobium quekettii TaxID=121088 RepID=A0A8S1JA68_9CHLO|nr:unnamed protein product [Ostreobium quekettii]
MASEGEPVAEDGPPAPPQAPQDGGAHPASAQPKGGGNAGDGAGNEAPGEVSELFSLVKDRPCRVAQIEVHGLHRATPALTSRELERVREGRTLEEIQDRVAECMVALEELDLFASVEGELLEGDEVGGRLWRPAVVPSVVAATRCCAAPVLFVVGGRVCCWQADCF